MGRRSCFGKMGQEGSVLCDLKYKPAKKEGEYLVIGVCNHLLFDRRVAQGVFDASIPLDKLVPTTPELLKVLKGKYGEDLFFKRIIGDLPIFAHKELKLEQKKASWFTDFRKGVTTQGNVYWMFYEQVGHNLDAGTYLFLVVKDQYNSEFKKTGIFRLHSWYGYMCRSVTFPCTRERFLEQMYDKSVSYDELFERNYKGMWTINDHSAFPTNNAMLKFKDPELYFADTFSIKMWSWIRMLAKTGNKPAGSNFHVMKEDDEKYSVLIHRFQKIDWISNFIMLVSIGLFIGVAFIGVAGGHDHH